LRAYWLGIRDTAKCCGSTSAAKADGEPRRTESKNTTVHLYTHPACLLHNPGEGHPESPTRLAAVLEAIENAQVPGLEWREAPAASRTQLLRVHAPTHIARVLDEPVTDFVRLDADTGMSADSPEAALRAAGAACAAVDAVILGECRRAFCAVRPPGHHATADTPMGFCLFNSIAVAAAHALDAHRLARVAIIDFDVHHGNGTQDIFQHEPRVMYVSSHQRGLYPGSGHADERGAGNLLNAPLPEGTPGAEFRRAWSEQLLPEIDAFRPELILISAGFDAHRLDPLAGLMLEASDYYWLTIELGAIATRHARGRIVSCLEGGYSLTALRECSVAHLRALIV
jgi:acetoin utilization deacetylase AcuC-like enzyme